MRDLGVPHADEEVKVISEANKLVADEEANLFQKKYYKLIILAFLIAFFNQFSGINFILYYAPEILERAGLAARESLFNSIAIANEDNIWIKEAGVS